MIKKYEVKYVWHSGECFGAREDREDIFEIEEENLATWKHDFQEDRMDGSYRTINSIEEVRKWLKVQNC